MLMDNNGGASAVSGENRPILTPPETAPSGEVDNFEEYLNSREDLKPEGEQPVEMNAEAESVAAEAAPEQAVDVVPTAVPVADELEQEPERASITELKAIEIQRDAESLPKEYVNKVSAIIKEDSKDPHQLSADCDILRWDLMRKAFGRNRGDGLNGNTVA